MSRLIGIFGGTFDPIHLGHLNSIKLLDQECRFDQVQWVLSARPPHKNQVSASIDDRLSMLELALRDEPNYYPNDTEISREEKSYTFDTVIQFKEKFPHDTLCLIIGGDSLLKLNTWHRYSELIEQVHLIVMHRPGYALKVPSYLKNRLVEPHELSKYNAGKLVLFTQSEFDVSSTKLRHAITEEIPSKSSQSLIQQYIAEPVIEYIYQHSLYKKV